MNICVYIESCTAFTSGTPSRGMLVELINASPDWHFILVLRTRDEKLPHLDEYFSKLNNFKNVRFHYEYISRKVVYLGNLLGFRNYNRVRVKADVYLTFDIDTLGKGNTPLIALLADLSSIRAPQKSSLGVLGRRLRKNALKILLKDVHKIVCISNFTRKDLHDYIHVDAEKTVTIHNGIMSEWLTRDRTASSSKEKYWIWYGWMSRRKNLINLLFAYRLFLDNYRNEHCIPPKLRLVGNGKKEYVIEVQETINSLHLMDFVSIYKPQELSSLISMVDASCGLTFPSFYEGFGLPVIEVLARGKQVLTSNTTAMKEIAHFSNIIIEPNSVNSIFEGLMTLHSYAEQDFNYEYQAYAKLYSYQESANKYRQLIESVIYDPLTKV